MSRDPDLYLEDIRVACKDVLEFTAGLTLESLINDKLRRQATIHSIFIIGEATKHVPADVRARYPRLRWREMAGLRDRIAHAYFGLDYEMVWDIVENDIPFLLETLGEPNA